ncbi:MAG: ATP-dependent DNA helicase RecQ [Spirochaetaceae bacterium]|nr:MAG: ATP-dependent DNA helicase RecQ [Spirochaetaceae bacterium]
MEDTLLQLARERFGLDYLFPYQRLVITNILAAFEARKSVPDEGDASGDAPGDTSEYGRQIVILPTGAGKSLCFQLPAAALSGITLVVYPLLSLMNDQARRMSEGGFSVIQLKGGQSKAERREALDTVRKGAVDFVITNPETLQSRTIRESLRAAGPVHAVIDEAHCISEWGDTFRPLYLTLGDTLRDLAVPIVTAFTATAGDHVLRRIREVLFQGEGVQVIRGNPDRENISYSVVPCLSRVHALRAMFNAEVPRGREQSQKDEPADTLPVWRPGDPVPLPAIVFCATRAYTQIHAAHLERVLGPGRALHYHAGLDRARKKAVEETFFHSRDSVLCATCAYGMGVDKPDIRAVIHTYLPESVEAFLQESGRGGRDRKPALSIILIDPAEEKRYRDAIGMGVSDGDDAAIRAPTIVQRMAFEAGCRREILLKAMGMEPEACSGCDRCEAGHRDGHTGSGLLPRETPASRMVRSLVAGAPGRYTTGEWIRLLRGLASWQDWCRLIPYRRGFGHFSHWASEELEGAFEELIALGVLRKRRNGRLWSPPNRADAGRRDLPPPCRTPETVTR